MFPTMSFCGQVLQGDLLEADDRVAKSDSSDVRGVMIHTFPSLYSLYYFTILAIFPIALAPFLSVLPLLAIVPAF